MQKVFLIQFDLSLLCKFPACFRVAANIGDNLLTNTYENWVLTLIEIYKKEKTTEMLSKRKDILFIIYLEAIEFGA